MKKIFSILVLTISLVSFVPVFAHETGAPHTHSVDDAVIEESLKEKGLDKAPGVVEVPEREMLGEAPYSGYVDDNGNPISDEDYNKMQEDEDARTQRNRIIGGVAIAIIAAIAAAILIKRTRSRQ